MPETISEECVHHWLISNPSTHFARHGKGDLVETTDQVCKKCGAQRLNDCVVLESGIVYVSKAEADWPKEERRMLAIEYNHYGRDWDQWRL